MKKLDLSGQWRVSFPDGRFAGTVELPGSSCEASIGKEAHFADHYEKSVVRAPLEKFEYIGSLLYEREIEIPEDFAGCDITLFLERVNMASKLFFDGVMVGRGQVSLSAPHVYRISDRVDGNGKLLFENITGIHTIGIEVDNSNFLNLGDMSSGYSVDTQGYWNGIIGRMELIAKPACNIESVQVYPTEAGIDISVITISGQHVPLEIKKGRLIYELILPGGEVRGPLVQEIEVFSKRQRNHFSIALKPEDKIPWDEFDTSLYTVKVGLELSENDGFSLVDEYRQKFGYRTISVFDKRFFINDRPISLRGTINCAQYPLTGYPPMDLDTWCEHFKVFKENGMNHVRCHAWCPPEAAFEAADIIGIYLSVEMPLWLNRDVTPMEVGDDEWHTLFFRNEGLRILESYGNHPSFCFFPNGNENLGDYALLETMTTEFKALDPRHLYTMTSNFDHPLSPCEDYISAFEILHYKARIQFLQDEVGEATNVNYDEMAQAVPVPFASFEVGQYCVYPDVDICEDYTGNMLPVNFDIIRKMMNEHNVYHRLKDYIMASGDLAAKLYKEDIEAVLRTEGMGGFQLLSFVDYTGQSTATVGIYDILHRPKGIISTENWTQFCNDVVPLFEAKRIFTNREDLSGLVSLYDYGRFKMVNPKYEITLEHNGKVIEKVFAEGLGKIPVTISLSKVTTNSLLYVRVKVRDGFDSHEYTNTWRIFVYCEDEESLPDTLNPIIDRPAQLQEAYELGGTYIALPSAYENEHFAKNSFIPVFWSPVHFPSEDPTGAIINENHDLLRDFPTEHYIDYQWKDLLEHSVSMDISSKQDIDVVMEMVPNYVDNVPKSPLFIYNHGKARIIFCGFQLSGPAAASLPAQALIKSLTRF